MKTVKLCDVCEFRRGLTYKKTDEVAVSDKIVLRANNIDLNNFRLNLDELKYISDTIEIPSSKYLLADSIFICTASGSKSHLGKVAYIDRDYPYAFGGFMGLIVPKREIIDGKFLYKVLISKPFRNRIDELMDGTNINNLKFKDIEDFEFALPSLKEQRRIVARLDAAFEKIDRAIELTEKNIESSSRVFENYLQNKMANLEWDKVKLPTISTYFNGLTYRPSDVGEIGTIVLRSSNIQNDEIALGDIVRVSSSVKEKLYVINGDILMCSRNGSKRLIGKTAIINNLDEPMTFGTFMMIVRSKLNPYLIWFFKSNSFRSQLSRGEATQINQITRYILDDVTVPIPPEDEIANTAKDIEAVFKSTRAAQKLYAKKLDYLKVLKQSMLTQAFSQDEVN